MLYHCSFHNPLVPLIFLTTLYNFFSPRPEKSEQRVCTSFLQLLFKWLQSRLPKTTGAYSLEPWRPEVQNQGGLPPVLWGKIQSLSLPASCGCWHSLACGSISLLHFHAASSSSSGCLRSPYSFLHKPMDLGHIEIIHYIYYCRQETLRRNWVAITVNKSLKCSPWIQSQERQNDLCSYPRQTIQYHSNPSLCPNQ